MIGLDRRPFDDRPKDVEHHAVDLRSKKARDVFRNRDVDALIHMGVMHAPRTSAEKFAVFTAVTDALMSPAIGTRAGEFNRISGMTKFPSSERADTVAKAIGQANNPQ